nr:SDR family oxidoreductase [Salsipaludibacter albus]
MVIGGGGGIGSEVARRLPGTVVVAGRDMASLEAIADEVGAHTRQLDARDLNAVSDVFDEIVDEHGRLDGVVNAAGSVVIKPAHLTTPDEWVAIVGTNLTTAFATVRAAGAAMRDGGSVVLVSTAAATTGLANHEAIAASKGGIDALVRSAASTYGRRGLRCNAVAPGLVRTPQTARLTDNETQAETSRAMHALGRLGEPADVADAILFLLDPDNDWITGQVLGVDGGLGRVRTR